MLPESIVQICSYVLHNVQLQTHTYVLMYVGGNHILYAQSDTMRYMG